MLPIRTTAKAIANYMAKHLRNRLPEDKGVHLVRCGNGMLRVRSRFSFNSKGARLYRQKLAAFAAQPHIRAAGVREYSDLKRVFGPRWAYRLAEAILAMEPVPE
jgi:hypothetical protein